MFLFEVVALRSRLSQAKLCASAQYFSMGGNPMSTNDTFASYMAAFATFWMSAKPRSAMPLSCGVLAEVNARLMLCFLQNSANLPPINSGASSERMI